MVVVGGRVRVAAMMLCGAAGATGLSIPAHAGDATSFWSPSPATVMPAVDGVNAKAEAVGGSLANRSLVGSQGAVSVPLAGPFGVQVDGAFGSFDHSAFGNIAGHAFWRNPGQGLLGIYTSHTFWDRYGGAYVGQVAGEAEYYFGRWTLQGIAGVEFGRTASSTSTTTSIVAPGAYNMFGIGTAGLATTTALTGGYDVRTRFFDQINIKYYFTDDWSGYAGHRYLGGKNALALGTEYALPLHNRIQASAFVEARVGEKQTQGIWGGVKFYFGQHDKPLIARNRQDDPNIWGLDTLYSITNSQRNSTGGSSSTPFCNPGNRVHYDPGTNTCSIPN